MKRRHQVNVISMSFLDAITCGFGAIILFFMIITANIDLRREAVLEDRSSEVDRIELEVLVGRKNLVQLKQDLERLIEEWASSRAAREQVVTEITRTQEEIETLTQESDSRRDLVEQLRDDLAALRAQTNELTATTISPEDAGNFIRAVRGEGYRQYLTGMRMGGERIVVLVDVSTSMLDRTLVNVLRRRNMSPEQKRQAPKWRQVVDTVDWITAQVPPTSEVQIFAFNDRAWSLIDGTDGQWVSVGDGAPLNMAVENMRALTPGGPTSLHAAFAAVNALSPKPDNIYLLVDGLPTMGEIKPSRPGVTSRERRSHFQRAIRDAPFNVPINVILFAMEGDPWAAPDFWALSLKSGGSMMAPAEDWP